jgi:protein kinase
VLGSFVLVGTKGVSENNVARRFSTGTLSTMKSHSSAPTKLNSLSKTGVQRKLHMDRQAPQKSTRSTDNSNKLTTNRVPARNSPGNPVLRHSRSLPETGRGAMQKVSSITEKLSHMSVTSRTRSTVKPAVPMLKAGHAKSDFLGKSDDIPPAKRLTRKLVS